MVGFLSDDKYGEKKAVLSRDAVEDWAETVQEDFRYDERFDFLLFEPDEGDGVDAIMTEDIFPYLEHDNQTQPLADEDIDVLTTFGVNLGVAIGLAIEEYTDRQERQDAVGEAVVTDVASYSNSRDVVLSGTFNQEFNTAVHAGYDQYRELLAVDEQYTIDLEDEGSITVYRKHALP